VQGAEIIIILLVALIVFGPERLPDLARKVGGWAAEVRKAARDLQTGLEAEVEEVKRLREELGVSAREVGKALDDITKPAGWTGPKPVSGPTPEDAMADWQKIQRGEDPEAEA
jgi:Tat protein translocase TatB subunit